MNTIESDTTESDRVNARNRRKSSSTYALEILEALRHAAPYSTTFIEGITYDQRRAVEEELKRSFEQWANTWIAPLCREIISKNTP